MSEGNAAESYEPIPNHTVDPVTGFIESNAYLDVFDASRKVMFLQALRARDFDMRATCKAFGISAETVYKHKRMDKAFAEALKDITEEYADGLEWVSMSNAMNPRSVIERIFQLKALRPEKYETQRERTGQVNVSINVDASLIGNIAKRIESLDAQAIEADVIPNDVPDRPLI